MPVDDPPPDPTDPVAHYTEDPEGRDGGPTNADIPDGGGVGPAKDRPPPPGWLKGQP